MALKFEFSTNGSVWTDITGELVGLFGPVLNDPNLVFRRKIGASPGTQVFAMRSRRGIAPPLPPNEVRITDEELDSGNGVRIFAGVVKQTEQLDDGGRLPGAFPEQAYTIVTVQDYTALFQRVVINKNYLEESDRDIILDIVGQVADIDATTSTVSEIETSITLILEGNRSLNAWDALQKVVQQTGALAYIDAGPGVSTGKATLYYHAAPASADGAFGFSTNIADINSTTKIYDGRKARFITEWANPANKVSVYGGTVNGMVISASAENTTSTGTYGDYDRTIRLPDEYDETRLQAIADLEVANNGAPRYSVELESDEWGLSVGEKIRVRNYAIDFDQSMVLRELEWVYAKVNPENNTFVGNTVRRQRLILGDRDLSQEADIAELEKLAGGAAAGGASAVKIRMVDFNGTTQYVSWATDTTFRGDNGVNLSWSISAWIELDDIVGTQSIVSVEDKFKVSVASGRVRVDVTFATTDSFRETTLILSANELYNIVATWNGQTAATGIKIYVNGVEGTYFNSSGGSGGVNPSLNDLQFGRHIATDYLDGCIGEVAIWQGDFGFGEVERLASAPSPDVVGGIGNLLGYWRHNDAPAGDTASTIRDSSGNQRDASATNSPAHAEKIYVTR